MADARERSAPRLPPRWFIRGFWFAHRRVERLTKGRLGLWRPKPGKWGAMRVAAIGRRSGAARPVIVGYFEDGDHLVTMAMNGWMDGEPAWWLNLQAHPEVDVTTRDGTQRMVAHAATGDERDRLWGRWSEIDDHLEDYAARRSMPTAVVVFEPVPA